MTMRLAVVTSVWDAAQAADSVLEFAARDCYLSTLIHSYLNLNN